MNDLWLLTYVMHNDHSINLEPYKLLSELQIIV